MDTLKNRIHPFEFLQTARFRECFYPADITDDVREELKDIHPSLIIGDNISFMIFKITYSYTDNRGHNKERYKYVLLKEYADLDEYEASIMAEGLFQTWVSDFNFKYPFRAISNVKILENTPRCNAHLLVG